MFNSLPWDRIAGPLATTEDALARLDERLANSPITGGWIARTHFSEAAASLWLDGELVDLEDLVLHDAGMDIRSPTLELARAHTVLRARRRIATAPPTWALSPSGLASLRGRGGEGGRSGEYVAAGLPPDPAAVDRIYPDEPYRDDFWPGAPQTAELEDDMADAVAALDKLLVRSDRILADPGWSGAASPRRTPPDPRFHDLDWNEDERLADWRHTVTATTSLPPTLAAALALDAWDTIAPLQHLAWLGPLMVGALLRERAKTRAHLLCFAGGLRTVRRERRRAKTEAVRLTALLEAMAAAAEIGLAEHDRWMLARTILMRKLEGRRSNSRLPALVDYVLSRPLVSAGMIADALDVTPRAAQDMVAELGLREMTGRGRYRAWGVL